MDLEEGTYTVLVQGDGVPSPEIGALHDAIALGDRALAFRSAAQAVRCAVGDAQGDGDEPIDRRLGRRGRPRRRERFNRDAAVRRLDEREHGFAQAAFDQCHRMDAMRESTQFVSHRADTRLCFGRTWRSLERERERQQALLCAVVQVALEPPPLGASLDEPRGGRADLLLLQAG